MLPKETISHIQSVGCLGQKEVVTASHNACIRELLWEIEVHGKADRHMKLLTLEKESSLGSLWDQEQWSVREAWDHEHSKDEMNIDLRGLERHYWNGTEAGLLGCYDFPGESWAGDGSVHKGAMGAGIVCLQRPTCIIVVRVGGRKKVSAL